MVEDDLKDTFFVVEATSFEVHMLWREWHKAVEMVQDNLGYMDTIGYIDDRPVCIDIRRYKIWGKSVIFYDACSQVVDHKMVEEWVNANILAHCPKWDNGTRVSHTNAWNFPHCIDAVEEATGKKRDITKFQW